MDVPAIPFTALVSWTGWTGLFLVVVWWIRGAPERRRADTAAEVDRKRLAMEGEAALRTSYGEQMDRLSARLDKMEEEHERDRSAWIAERTAMRIEYEADQKRWNAEREQWRRERTQLLDQVDGLERKIRSYGSSAGHLEQGGVNAPTTIARLVIDHENKEASG